MAERKYFRWLNPPVPETEESSQLPRTSEWRYMIEHHGVNAPLPANLEVDHQQERQEEECLEAGSHHPEDRSEVSSEHSEMALGMEHHHSLSQLMHVTEQHTVNPLPAEIDCQLGRQEESLEAATDQPELVLGMEHHHSVSDECQSFSSLSSVESSDSENSFSLLDAVEVAVNDVVFDIEQVDECSDSSSVVHAQGGSTIIHSQLFDSQNLGILDRVVNVQDETDGQTDGADDSTAASRSSTPATLDIDFNSDMEVETQNIEDDMFPALPVMDYLEEQPSDNIQEESTLQERNVDLLEPLWSDTYSVLKDRLQNSYKTIIEASVKVSRGELLLNCLTFVTHFQLNFSTFEGTMKLINSLFQSNVLPDTRYMLDVLLKSFAGMQYHFVCTDCFNYLGEIEQCVTKSVVCDMCLKCNIVSNLNEALFFAMFDIPSQIEVILTDPVKASTLKNPFHLVNNQEPGVMSDLYDGDVYQQFIASLTPEENIRHVSICFSVDGAALYSSSNCEIWPLFGCLLEIDKKYRMKNLLLCGLWFGNSKPKQDVFLKPFIEKMNHLSTTGFRVKVGSDIWNMKAHLLGCCADAPARAAVQCVHQHNGSYGCNWCLHPNENRKYVCLNFVPELRTQEELIRDGAAVLAIEQPNASVNGVVGLSPCLASKTLDMVAGMLLEYFHAAAHGIARQLTGAWLGDDGADEKLVPYYIGKPANLRSIDAYLKSIKMPIEARRFPRKISEREHWKGREFENFLLYYSVPVLLPFLPTKYLKHWALFAQSLHLLLQEKIPERNINAAHLLLSEFLVKTENLYGVQHMTYNMHIICSHAAQHVKRWGPLWSINGYGFEDGNKAIKSTIHANKGTASQVCRALCHTKAKDLLRAHAGNVSTQEFQDTLKKKTVSKCMYIGEDDRYLGASKSFNPSQAEIWMFQQEGIDFNLFSEVPKLIHCGCVYSSPSKDRKSDNSVALLKNDSFVLIEKIIVSQQLHQGFLICKRIFTTPHYLPRGIHPNDAFLRLITHISPECVLYKPSELKIVSARISLPHGDFIVKVPDICNTC